MDHLVLGLVTSLLILILLMNFFANIATDTHYDSGVIEKLIDSLPVYSQTRGVLFCEYEVFKMLTKVKKTAAGVD